MKTTKFDTFKRFLAAYDVAKAENSIADATTATLAFASNTPGPYIDLCADLVARGRSIGDAIATVDKLVDPPSVDPVEPIAIIFRGKTEAECINKMLQHPALVKK